MQRPRILFGVYQKLLWPAEGCSWNGENKHTWQNAEVSDLYSVLEHKPHEYAGFQGRITFFCDLGNIICYDLQNLKPSDQLHMCLNDFLQSFYPGQKEPGSVQGMSELPW